MNWLNAEWSFSKSVKLVSRGMRFAAGGNKGEQREGLDRGDEKEGKREMGWRKKERGRERETGGGITPWLLGR